MKTKSIAFERRFFSLKSIAPQANDTTTEPRRIIDTTDIIASPSDSATKYARSAAERKSEMRGMAHDQWNGVWLGCSKWMSVTAIAIIENW
jgi:hypothetical protein